MARRSLRPHLNQIRTWVRQGRTDAWVAHQLEVTVQQIEAFKKENDLLPDGESSDAPGVDFDDEIDLRAEDDALIAAELEAEAARRAEAGDDEDEPSDEPVRTARPSAVGAAAAAAAAHAPEPAQRRAPPTRAPSTTVKRATACGWTRRSPTTAPTPSTGRATARSR